MWAGQTAPVYPAKVSTGTGLMLNLLALLPESKTKRPRSLPWAFCIAGIKAGLRSKLSTQEQL